MYCLYESTIHRVQFRPSVFLACIALWAKRCFFDDHSQDSNWNAQWDTYKKFSHTVGGYSGWSKATKHKICTASVTAFPRAASPRGGPLVVMSFPAGG